MSLFDINLTNSLQTVTNSLSIDICSCMLCSECVVHCADFAARHCLSYVLAALSSHCSCMLCSECVVQCADFAARHCLSYVLSALSSHADDTRLAAYHCLRLYYDHVDAAVSQHHRAIPAMLLYLLDCVRYGIDESNARLPCIVTTFLARAAYLLTTPGVTSCLL